MRYAAELSRPGIDPADPTFAAMLEHLQGNILKPHARDHASHLLFRLAPDRRTAARAWVRAFAAARITSARRQLDEAARFRLDRIPGGTFGGFLLSAAGYGALGGHLRLPADARFRGGLKRAWRALHDPPPGSWEREYRGAIHGLVLLADDDSAVLARETERARRELGRFARVLVVERGRVWRNRQDEAVEHFGYVDGRSQPLFLRDEIERERERGGKTDAWDPSAPLDLVLVADPNAPADDCFGSYMVFRKLEQNVRAFKERETRLAAVLGLRGEEAERAGALVIGRFEDGTPLALADEARGDDPVPNDFTYADDPRGTRCPVHAHIRAVNARDPASRGRRLARRGITYGERRTAPGEARRYAEMPTRGVGVLFMCFQANIEAQFEEAQRRANAAPGPPGEALIGQGRQGTPARWPSRYGRPGTTPFDFRRARVVTLKGGEYFFAPSLPFLRNL